VRALALTGVLLALSAGAASAATTVHVVRCPTTYGVAQPAPRLPSRLSVSASTKAVADLDAYSNGVLFLLAPSGLPCHAVVGADGSASITITPGSMTHVRQPAVTASFADTPGTAASLACPLFPAAVRQLSGQSCPRAKPARESTSAGGQGTLYFADPPRVHGDGAPSGGSDAARGVLVFLAQSRGFDGYAFRVTCTLPASDRGECATILADALTRIPANE
jgi:hypothetical protein